MEQKGVRLSKSAGLTVEKVEPDSIAEAVGVEAGDRLISVNGREMKDVLDYRFVEGEEELLLELAKPNGEVWEVEVESEVGEGTIFRVEIPLTEEAGNVAAAQPAKA